MVGFASILPGWVRKALGIKTGSAPDFGDLKDGGSVNDAIIQNGTIITTSPEDSIIATKQPEGLFKSMASKLGNLFGGGEEGGGIGSKIGGLFDGIKSIASQGLQAAAGVVQGMSGGVSKETVVQMAEDIKLVMKEGQEELLNTLMEISEASKNCKY